MSKSPIRFVIRTDAVSMMLPGEAEPRMVRNDHKQFADIVSALRNDDIPRVLALLNPLEAFCSKQQGRLVLEKGNLLFDGETIHEVIHSKITEMINRDEDASKFVRFMENLKENPEQRALDELYSFIKTNALPLTEDGYLLAYKSVRRDFLDHHSQSFDYSPGKTVSMDRELVCNDPNVTCAPGLHVCSIGYLQNMLFGGDRKSRVVLVKVHPRDVVCVPYDYQDSKVRCCAMTVLAEFRVHSGTELYRVDSAIKENLKALQQHVMLNEDDLRAIIGIPAPKDNLEAFGEFGQVVKFKHEGKVIEGHLLKGVLPSENLHEALDVAVDGIYTKFLPKYVDDNFSVDEVNITNLDTIRAEKIISLDNRVILMSTDLLDIQIKAEDLDETVFVVGINLDDVTVVGVELNVNLYLKSAEDIVAS